MSQALDDFKTAALAKNWPTAVLKCNGLSMYEVLRELDSSPLDDRAPVRVVS